VTGLDKEHSHVIEYSIKLESNPEFTAGALVASARGVYRLAKEGKSGCFTMFDLPPAYLSSKSPEELRKALL
jgi:diaminopimelate dehydrogenase